MLVGGHIWWQDSGETALHRIQLRHIGFIEPKEFAISAADDWEKFLLLPGAVFAHEDNHFLPVKRFGWRFGHVEFLARLGRLHPGFHRHDTDGGGVGDAHEPGGGGKSVFFAFIRQRSRDEHKRTVRANQEKRGSHLAAVTHTEFRVMAGLGHEVVERFELGRLLHCRKFELEENFNQAANTEKPPPVRGSGCVVQ